MTDSVFGLVNTEIYKSRTHRGGRGGGIVGGIFFLPYGTAVIGQSVHLGGNIGVSKTDRRNCQRFGVVDADISFIRFTLEISRIYGSFSSL